MRELRHALPGAAKPCLRRIGLAAAFLALAAFSPLQRHVPEVSDGIEHFRDGRYEESVHAFRQAQARGVKDARLTYDLGVSLYQLALNTGGAQLRSQRLDEARLSFQAVHGQLAADLSARAHYNLGNSLYRLELYADAAEAFKRALALEPTFEDARVNLELALKRRPGHERTAASPRAPDPSEHAPSTRDAAEDPAAAAQRFEEQERKLDWLERRSRELRIAKTQKRWTTQVDAAPLEDW